MSQQISVTTPGMQKAAGEFQAALGTSNATLNTMRNHISTLGVAWTGEAALRFGTSMNAWCTEYQNIVKQLSTMLEALQGNSKTYVRNEQAAVEAAGNAMPGLPGL